MEAVGNIQCCPRGRVLGRWAHEHQADRIPGPRTKRRGCDVRYSDLRKRRICPPYAGTAYWSATHEDYLLPSAVLNSTVSGLVSRTILNNEYIKNEDFHGCIFYENLIKDDVSLWFVDKIISLFKKNKNNYIFSENNQNKDLIINKSLETLNFFMKKYNFNNINFVKPGVGESTRVLLRRVPKEIWIKNENDTSLKHLIFLAKNKNINLYINPNLSYNAVAIIEELD